jgi:hypothetical protein
MKPLAPTVRPRSVTLTLWGVFLLGIWNVGRALAISQQRALLQELAAQPDPLIRLLLALVWGVVFFGLGEALRCKRPFTRRFIPLAIALYAFYEFSLLIFFAPTTPAQTTLVFDGLLALLGITVTTWALNRTAVAPYFQ